VLLALLPAMLTVTADEAAGSGPQTAATTQPAPADSAGNGFAQSPPEAALAFDPALIGLPEFPLPMRTSDDFRNALDLIDRRVAESSAMLDAASASAAEAEAEIQAVADQDADSSKEGEPSGEGNGTLDPERQEGAGAEPRSDSSRLEAKMARLEQRIEKLRELRIAVQRNATLSDRLAEAEDRREKLRKQAEAIEADGFELEPPFPVSLLDRLQAKLVLKQAVEAVQETGIATAERRRDAVARGLSNAVRERRAARNRVKDLESEADASADREALEEELELARLRELLMRQQLAASERTAKLARAEDDLAEAEQGLVSERIRFVEAQVVLPRDTLEDQLAQLAETEEAMRADIESLQLRGDRAEAVLFRAQRRLANTGAAEDKAALTEWVATRQAEVVAARTSVDNLTLAMDLLSRMQTLWELRYQLMSAPESVELPELLREVTDGLSEARREKESLVERLNALRSIQLAQARRSREPGLSEDMREAMSVRSAAQELAELHGRELLGRQDDLISLLQGMRRQLTTQLEAQNISLKMLRAQETFERWWDAEVVVIDDQSIRVRELVTAVAMFLVVLLVVSLIRAGARRALRRRKAKSPKTEYGDLRLALSAIAGNTSQIFVLIAAFYVAMTFSGLASRTVEGWLWTLLVIAFYAQLGIWANAAMVDYFNRRRTRQEMRDPSTVTGYGLLMFFVRVGIWLVVGVSLLAYFRYPIAGLVGALGVGSLAVAFAVQNILGDVFSSMAIILDKPFRVGDFVKAGETLGVIEHIGVKTTRIRSLSGEQVVLSNSDLLNSRIHNYKQFKERRVVFRLSVVYQTPRDLLERIPGMLREAIEAVPRTRFDRAHFVEYGDFALVFEIVYYVLSPDYDIYMDSQQAINLGIHRRFEEAGVSFAYPTQELIVRRLAPSAAV
ncbi:MAG: mechanosensitive ion channel, partial [Thiohalocapsa sp.]|nr:mechanosensitive ion channel [Thiohalocapsa sp.]